MFDNLFNYEENENTVEFVEEIVIDSEDDLNMLLRVYNKIISTINNAIIGMLKKVIKTTVKIDNKINDFDEEKYNIDVDSELLLFKKYRKEYNKKCKKVNRKLNARLKLMVVNRHVGIACSNACRKLMKVNEKYNR